VTSARDLELALRARWDRETLLVYADALQAAGDPRGELIALDIEIAERGVTPELARRRRQRLYEWLGGMTIARRPVHEASFLYGFATDFHVASDRNTLAPAYLEALFASPAGPFVRGLTLHVGRPANLREVFAVIVREVRPWLERLEVRVVDDGPVISEDLVDALIAATPRLCTLAVTGAEAFPRFPHPAVRALATGSPRLALAQTIPGLVELDLLLDGDDVDDNETGDDPQIIAILDELPALRVLDLSRNEPSYPPREGDGIYPFVRWLPLGRIERLRLPSLRTRTQIASLGETIDHAPATQFEIARTYDQHVATLASVGHPRLALPAPFVWPPPDTMSSREALTITVPTEEYGDDVSLTQLIDCLETQFATLPPNARAAWIDFWTFLADLPWEDKDGHAVTRMFPATTLLTALEPLDDFIPSSGVGGHWAQLAEKLRSAELPPEAVVGIRRYWGW
jgi:hypothetical protein